MIKFNIDDKKQIITIIDNEIILKFKLKTFQNILRYPYKNKQFNTAFSKEQWIINNEYIKKNNDFILKINLKRKNHSISFLKSQIPKKILLEI